MLSGPINSPASKIGTIANITHIPLAVYLLGNNTPKIK